MQKTIIAVFAALVLGFSGGAWAADWTVPGNFTTIQEAIDSALVLNGDRILVGPGNFAGALVNKSIEIKGVGGATIDSGPMHPAGLSMGFRFLTGSDGATISHLNFTVDLAIMNGNAVDDVTVTQCTFNNTIQAISNWCGERWNITHNEIIDLRTRNGGGIGILVGDYLGGTVQDNVVAHNKISGTLHVYASDGGGYNGSGIVLYADFRWGRAGTSNMSYNRVVKNNISISSDTQEVVDVVAFEMTDSRDDLSHSVICNNAIGFNDFRGTAMQIDLTPDNLDSCNEISRNLGDNRGHGLHPSVFGPN